MHLCAHSFLQSEQHDYQPPPIPPPQKHGRLLWLPPVSHCNGCKQMAAFEGQRQKIGSYGRGEDETRLRDGFGSVENQDTGFSGRQYVITCLLLGDTVLMCVQCCYVYVCDSALVWLIFSTLTFDSVSLHLFFTHATALQVPATKDIAKWKWDIIADLFEGPLNNPTLLGYALGKTKLIKRVLSFLRPSQQSFCKMSWSAVRISEFANVFEITCKFCIDSVAAKCAVVRPFGLSSIRGFARKWLWQRILEHQVSDVSCELWVSVCCM